MLVVMNVWAPERSTQIPANQKASWPHRHPIYHQCIPNTMSDSWNQYIGRTSKLISSPNCNWNGPNRPLAQSIKGWRELWSEVLENRCSLWFRWDRRIETKVLPRRVMLTAEFRWLNIPRNGMTQIFEGTLGFWWALAKYYSVLEAVQLISMRSMRHCSPGSWRAIVTVWVHHKCPHIDWFR